MNFVAHRISQFPDFLCPPRERPVSDPACTSVPTANKTGHRTDLLTGIRLVVFDAVGTVITPRPSVKAIYTAIGRKFGSQLDEATVDRRFREVFRSTERNGARELPDPLNAVAWRTSEVEELARWRGIVDHVLDDVADREACFDELFRHFADAAVWHVYPDVRPALDGLAELGIELALASNFDARLHPVCDGLPDLQRLTRRFISSQVGVRKPARQFFAHILEQTGRSASEVLMVGDDAVNDVAGARESGLRAVRVDRKGVPAEGEIARLTELLGL
jgi:putative hydrolase of the HAD superfamily